MAIRVYTCMKRDSKKGSNISSSTEAKSLIKNSKEEPDGLVPALLFLLYEPKNITSNEDPDTGDICHCRISDI